MMSVGGVRFATPQSELLGSSPSKFTFKHHQSPQPLIQSPYPASQGLFWEWKSSIFVLAWLQKQFRVLSKSIQALNCFFFLGYCFLLGLFLFPKFRDCFSLCTHTVAHTVLFSRERKRFPTTTTSISSLK